MNFESITTKQGLPSNKVICIAKDSLGFIWYGTTLGLVRSDGTRLETYKHNPENPESIPSECIVRLEVSKNGIIWGLTLNGLMFSFNPYAKKGKYITRHTISKTKPNIKTFTLSGNIIYAGTDDGNIWKYNESNQWIMQEICLQNDTPTLKKINCLVERNSNLWIATDQGLFHLQLNNAQLSRFDHLCFLAEDVNNEEKKEILDLQVINDSMLILAPNIRYPGSYYGVLQFNMDKKYFCFLDFEIPEGKKSRDYKLEFVRNNGNDEILVLFFGRGPVVYNFKNQTSDTIEYNSKAINKLQTYSIRNFYKDGDKLYIVTNQGVFYHDPYSYLFNEILPLKSDKQFAGLGYTYLFEDRNLLMLLYPKNLKIYDLNADSLISTFSIDNNLPITKRNQITNFFPVNKDEILIISDEIFVYSAKDNALKKIYSREFFESTSLIKRSEIHYPYFTDVDSNLCNILYFYRDGNLIPLNLESLKIDSGKIISLLDYGLKNVNSIVKVNESQVLISNLSDTLHLFNHLQNFKKTASIVIPSNQERKTKIKDIFYDRATIWVATDNQGVLGYKNNGSLVKKFTISDGLATNYIEQIQSDNKGRIWVSTLYGISYINPGDNTILNFNKQHGFNFPHNMMPGKYKDNKGNLYFSEGIGIVFFSPEEVIKETDPPKVYITDLRIDEKTKTAVYRDTTIYLKYHENNISLSFCAINHVHGYMNKYKYKLEGLESKWYETDFQNLNVRYNQLSGGTYTFRLKASNHKGNWNEKGINLKLVIATPIWQRWWFYGLITSIIILTTVYIITARQRVKQKTEIEMIQREIRAQVQERERIARDLHDDIGAQLSTLKMYINAIKENSGNRNKLTEYSRESNEMIGKTIDSMRGIINELSPQTLSIYGYTAAVKEFVYYLSKATDVQFILSIDNFDCKLDKINETALFRITQELVNNSIKYASADTIQIKITNIEGVLYQLYYKDDGVGFYPENNKNGSGLTNIKSRVKVLQGIVEIHSAPGKGFECLIEFKNKSEL